jgi:hypothetical protein
MGAARPLRAARRRLGDDLRSALFVEVVDLAAVVDLAIAVVVALAAFVALWILYAATERRTELSADARTVHEVLKAPGGELGRGYSVAELAARTQLDVAAVEAAVDELEERRMASRSEDGLVWWGGGLPELD